MLLKRLKQYLAGAGLLFSAIALLTQCKGDSASRTDAESNLLADYEKPANPWGYMDIRGNLVIAPVFDAGLPFSEGKAAVNQDGKWGFINKTGEFIIAPQFKEAWSFHENRARVVPFDTTAHFIDPSGKIISSSAWSAADDFADGMARVKSGSLYGFVDTAGNMVIRPIYSRAWNFINSTALVESEGKMGVINQKGDYIISPRFDQISRGSTINMFFAQVGVKAVALDLKGKEIVQLAAAKMLDSDQQNLLVKRGDKKWLYSLSKRDWLMNKGFDQLYYLDASRWAAKTKDGYQILDAEGQAINANFYAQVNKFSGDIAAFQRDQFWGYINRDGLELGEPVFGLAWDFREGLARAAFQDGIGFITADLQLAFYPPRGAIDLRDFSEGLASVQIHGE